MGLRQSSNSRRCEPKQLITTNARPDYGSQTGPYTTEPQAGRRTPAIWNIVLLGMSGSGKSASGNSILREKRFISRPSSKPITSECQVAETKVNDFHVCVIDTPDIFDDDIAPSVRDKHVKKCKQLCESGPCVYVLVLHVSRFTNGERDIFKKLEKAFGSKVKEQTIILFTRGDDLRQAEMKFEDFLRTCQPELKAIIQKCDNRCVLFENSRQNDSQVKKLLETGMNLIQNQQTLLY
ncbi:uncharacterized protein LOC112431718 [Maylandia zebra]|uniref:uncharacterized protein LOC112431718 n=1 Tax=Maylandia zebra TaxID=106582 RepID=UPI00403C5CE4